MKQWLIIGCMSIASLYLSAQDRADYIESYKSIAIAEMLRTGIPASIKLAQAMHESNCGKSDLACKANNHFGIKCGNDWTGKSYKKEDDDYEGGQLVKSCFREFRSVYDSYIAHSDFLTDPAKAKRYGSLFELDVTDYKGWAKGLSKAGYATDPQYANKLIDLIERYKLYELDSSSGKEIASAKPKKSLGYNIVSYNNDIRYVLARRDDTPESIAERNDVTVRQVIKYNDDIDDEYQLLTEGAIVYLQPKRNQNHGKQKVHLLKQGETMVGLSQKYGIKLESLLQRNGLQPGQIPAPNQKILLKGKMKGKLRTIDPYDMPSIKQLPVSPSEEVQVSSTPTITTPSAPVQVKKDTSYQQAELVIQPVTMPQLHKVAKGDTLYSIARKYNMSVDELRKMNDLSSDTISIGQNLSVK